jgi:hypothetical protein
MYLGLFYTFSARHGSKRATGARVTGRCFTARGVPLAVSRGRRWPGHQRRWSHLRRLKRSPSFVPVRLGSGNGVQ